MASYNIAWRPSAYRDVKRLQRQLVSRIRNKIIRLADNPRPNDSRKLKDTSKTYRIRIGDYRVIYQIDDAQQEILVCYIRHRKDVYRS